VTGSANGLHSFTDAELEALKAAVAVETERRVVQQTNLEMMIVVEERDALVHNLRSQLETAAAQNEESKRAVQELTQVRPCSALRRRRHAVDAHRQPRRRSTRWKKRRGRPWR
jgi:hypothetical protein